MIGGRSGGDGRVSYLMSSRSLRTLSTITQRESLRGTVGDSHLILGVWVDFCEGMRWLGPHRGFAIFAPFRFAMLFAVVYALS